MSKPTLTAWLARAPTPPPDSPASNTIFLPLSLLLKAHILQVPTGSYLPPSVRTEAELQSLGTADTPCVHCWGTREC